MTLLVVLAFAAVAVIGAWVRVGATVALNRWSLPIGTLTVNLAGSFLAGVTVAHMDGNVRSVVVTGGWGALTTFSSFAVEVRAMGTDRRYLLAAGYVGLTGMGAVLAARMGLAL